MLKPKLFTTLQGYSSQQFLSDLTAGLIVGIVALPLAIAFAIASGVSPDKGLVTAIVAGFLISVLGGSRVQIGGPTGAFVVILYGIVNNYGLNGLIVATLMAGVILVIMGFARLGSVIKFMPYPVIVGFTSGIALIIFSSQVKDFFGLQMGTVPVDFVEKWIAFVQNLASINSYALAIALGSTIVIIFWQRFVHKIPGTLVALLLSTMVVQMFHLPVETIGSRFGEIPSMLPTPVLPTIEYATIKHLIQPATTIALLAAIESLLSAVVADGMIGGKHRSNMELIAQGVANIATSLFGGIPATGAIARTATNIKNGGRTPIAGITHAIVLLLVMLFFGRWATLIPLSCLAAILVVVAYNMSEWRSFKDLLKSPRSDVAVLLITFGLTVVFDLTVAIEIGVVLSVFLFMRRMAAVTNVGVVTRELKDEDETDDPNAIEKREIPKGVEVYEVNGPFFFGAAYKFEEAMRFIEKAPKVRIIRMRNVPAMDSTGLNVLKKVYNDCRKHNIAFLISDIHTQPLYALGQSEMIDLIGEENIFGNIDNALNRAREIVGLPKVERPVPFVPTVKREMA
ncbi:MAG: sulfate permease [Ignavibacteriae bacterium]|nr:sulfate permease [Ignavibacteria bacterium]MBI3363558.1 sulfate permease [Ignavibacteriota bacterium]